MRSHLVLRSPGVFLTVCEVLREGPSRSARLRMTAHAFLIVLAAWPVSLLLVAFATCEASTEERGGIPASFSRIRLPTARYAPKTLLRLLFCRISSFRSTCLRAVAIPCGMYQAAALYVILGLTTDVYTSLAILKHAPHVEAEIQSIAKDCAECF